jgi:glyoxylase-like metal-dependent hydrolase (beta-lactamase superfamily II)
MKQILPNFYFITGLPAGRVYVINDPDGVTLVDATIGGQTGRILDQVKSIGREPKDVKRIFITHAHPDHVGSLPDLKAATGAQVLVGALDKDATEGKKPVDRVPPEKLSGPLKFRPPSTSLKGTPVDVALNGGETLDAMGGMHVVFTPGHSPGHMSLWQPEKKVLICGDVLFHLFGIGLPPAFLTVDMEEDKRSVRKLADLKPSVLCFGHGDPVVENTAEQLEAFARKIGV